MNWDRLRRTGRKAEAKRVISKHLFLEAGVIRVLTLGKAKQTRLSPSCPLHSLTSQVLRRIRQRASVMHLKTMKCNPFCLIASLEDPDMFNRPEQRVRLHWHGALQYQNSFKCWKSQLLESHEWDDRMDDRKLSNSYLNSSCDLVFIDVNLICAFCVVCGWLNDLLMYDMCI